MWKELDLGSDRLTTELCGAAGMAVEDHDCVWRHVAWSGRTVLRHQKGNNNILKSTKSCSAKNAQQHDSFRNVFGH